MGQGGVHAVSLSKREPKSRDRACPGLSECFQPGRPGYGVSRMPAAMAVAPQAMLPRRCPAREAYPGAAVGIWRTGRTVRSPPQIRHKDQMSSKAMQ
jgi:hypothetical protein